MSAEEEDSILCELFSCLHTIGNLRKQYHQAVSEGYIQLSKARFNLGTSTVKSTQYPNTMIPMTGIDICEDQFIVVSMLQEDANDKLDIRQRLHKEKNEDKNKVHLFKSDPLCWFSGLPPHSLRMSQNCFKQSIEIAVTLVNTQAHLQLIQKKLTSLSKNTIT